MPLRIRYQYIILFLCVSMCYGCTKQPPIDDTTMLDGNKINDPSIASPEKYLVSAAFPNPTQQQKETPVVIAVHGYSATTYEWDEFRHWSDSVGKYYVSQVLLGGHGRDYESFKKASWEDWQRPIITEYKKLDSLGYNKISLIGSSTGCPLILEMVYSGKIKSNNNPKHILMIDPIIVPSSKMLSMIDLVGPALGYVKSDLDSGEVGHWYQYRPQESLNQLLELIDRVRKKLEDGIRLPAGTTMKVYKSIKDPSADPVSAVLLYKGIVNKDGSHIDIEMVHSKLHVFTRLQGRNSYTAKDKALQITTFKDIASIVEQ
jgi:carboxylesterase